MLVTHPGVCIYKAQSEEKVQGSVVLILELISSADLNEYSIPLARTFTLRKFHFRNRHHKVVLEFRKQIVTLPTFKVLMELNMRSLELGAEVLWRAHRKISPEPHKSLKT